MKSISLWGLALILAVGAAAIVKFQTGSAAEQLDAKQVASAPFRDGAYLGKLQAARGEAPHVAIARWSNDADRELFAAGYESGYMEQLAQSRKAQNNTSPNTGAAFRDGLYLGKLDSENGNAMHLAVGRWAQASDRAAFAEGYNQSYNNDSLTANRAQTLRLTVVAR